MALPIGRPYEGGREHTEASLLFRKSDRKLKWMLSYQNIDDFLWCFALNFDPIDLVHLISDVN